MLNLDYIGFPLLLKIKLLSTIAEKVIAFNKQLHYTGLLPEAFSVLNPFRQNPETIKVMSEFYYKFYNDNRQRKFLVGINPSRHGAALTGVPFTDTKRLQSACGIKMETCYSHEPSSVFIYEMIEAYGGAAAFYSNVYINSPFPLAIIKNTANGKFLNANYYDDKDLFRAVKPFMVACLREHLALGLQTDRVFILGKKNAQFLEAINREAKLFGELVVLEHPRFIQQYKSKDKGLYIEKYIAALGG